MATRITGGTLTVTINESLTLWLMLLVLIIELILKPLTKTFGSIDNLEKDY